VTEFPAVRASRAIAALLRIGWTVKRTKGAHRILSRPGYPDFTFAFHDRDEIGPKMLARIAKHTGLRPQDLLEATRVFVPYNARYHPAMASPISCGESS
jgi:predicted RNA binding protein YcfA (HicA-like mRNA interferase family)